MGQVPGKVTMMRMRVRTAAASNNSLLSSPHC